MKKVLLTGMSGTGKSTLVVELERRGFRAVDLDDPAWSMVAPDGDWVWREGRVRALLDDERGDVRDGVLFVSGCAENQVGFHPRFDEVVLLSAPKDVITERLGSRTNNAYGKRPEELAATLGYVDSVEPRLRRVATHEIVTTRPLEDVVREVLRIAGAGE